MTDETPTLQELIEAAENGELRPHPTISGAILVGGGAVKKFGIISPSEAGGWVNYHVLYDAAVNAPDFSVDDFGRLQRAVVGNTR